MPVDLARALGKLVLARLEAGEWVFDMDRKQVVQALKSSHQETDKTLAEKIGNTITNPMGRGR